jgi:glutathione synthase/RimK-type ligase-like ATP-grasp enzyme
LLQALGGFGCFTVVVATVGFVTCDSHPEIAADDEPFARALAGLGHGVRAVPWNSSESVAPPGVDALVLRAAWDVWQNEQAYTDYVAWLDTVERSDSGISMWNPPAVARWCLDKANVAELELSTARVPMTAVAPAGAIADTMRRRGWDQAVLKPAIGAAGDDVQLVDLDHAVAVDAEGTLHAWTPWLVQEFVAEVGSVGETSIVVVDGQVAHAVHKLPKAGDFRANAGFGSTLERVAPEGLPADVVRHTIPEVLDALPGEVFYARIDVIVAEQPIVLEVEAGDPTLWLRLAPETGALLADALHRRLRV